MTGGGGGGRSDGRGTLGRQARPKPTQDKRARPEGSAAQESSTVTLVHANSALGRSKLSDFPGGPVVKNRPADAGVTGLTLGPGRSHMLQGN